MREPVMQTMTKERERAYEPVAGFQSRKAAQIAAFFVASSGGRIEKLKLAKLQYLAEREFLRLYGRPIVYDELYSLPHGPICSSSLNAIDGKLGELPEWHDIKAHGRGTVTGRKAAPRDSLDELSDAEFAVVSGVWDRVGHMSAIELRAWTHNPANCPEYTEVVGSRLPISYEEVLVAVGQQRAEELADEVVSFRRLETMFQT
jgi:uncharacterized phage-associated protein